MRCIYLESHEGGSSLKVAVHISQEPLRRKQFESCGVNISKIKTLNHKRLKETLFSTFSWVLWGTNWEQLTWSARNRVEEKQTRHVTWRSQCGDSFTVRLNFGNLKSVNNILWLFPEIILLPLSSPNGLPVSLAVLRLLVNPIETLSLSPLHHWSLGTRQRSWEKDWLKLSCMRMAAVMHWFFSTRYTLSAACLTPVNNERPGLQWQMKTLCSSWLLSFSTEWQLAVLGNE